MGAGGYRDSTSGAPSIKHTSKSPPVYFTTTVILPGFTGGCNGTTTTSTRHGLILMPHHTPGEQIPPSIVSHRCRCGQAPQLQAINEKRKTQKAWSLSSANEFGQLANGIGGRIKNPTNTIEFIFQHEMPTERKRDVTYGQFVCTVQPKKAEPNRTRLTVGGDRINYPGKLKTHHPHCGNASGQNALQQRHLHKRCMLHDNGHLQLLPNDSIAPARIHVYELK